jgi:hypothetical protein
VPFAGTGVVLTMLVAAASWFEIEHPAWQLKNWPWSGRRVHTATGADHRDPGR